MRDCPLIYHHPGFIVASLKTLFLINSFGRIKMDAFSNIIGDFNYFLPNCFALSILSFNGYFYCYCCNDRHDRSDIANILSPEWNFEIFGHLSILDILIRITIEKDNKSFHNYHGLNSYFISKFKNLSETV